jgi:hypothetical protein
LETINQAFKPTLVQKYMQYTYVDARCHGGALHKEVIIPHLLF